MFRFAALQDIDVIFCLLHDTRTKHNIQLKIACSHSEQCCCSEVKLLLRYYTCRWQTGKSLTKL